MTADPGPVITSSRQALRLGWRHYAGWRVALAGVSVIATIGALAEMVIVLVVAQFATLAAASPSPDTASLLGGRLQVGAGALLVVGILAVVVRLAVELLAAWMQATIVADYDAGQRRRVVQAFCATTWPEQASARRGELLDLLTSYLNQTRLAMLAFSDAVVAGLTFAILLTAGLVTGGLVGVALVLTMAVIVLVLRPVTAWTRRSASEVARATPRFANQFTELVELSKAVKAFDVEAPAVARTDDAVTSLRQAWRNLYVAQSVGPIGLQSAIFLLAVVGLGLLVVGQAARPAAYIASVLLLYRSSQYGRTLHLALQSLVIASPFQHRLDEQVAQFESTREGSGVEPMPAMQRLDLDHIDFSYPGGEPVLVDFNLSIRAGEIVALAGRSGGGKTTVVDLLLRLERPDAGRLLVDGRPAEEIDLAAWRQAVAFVPQEGTLLDDTVAANVRFLRDDILDEDIARALNSAHVLDELLARRGGLDSTVGERGGSLSVGQRQRVCIARALVGHPQLLVLDEPTSALDPDSARAVHATIAALRGVVAVLVVSHRADTLSICDRMVELEPRHRTPR